MVSIDVPLIIRGEIIEECDKEYCGQDSDIVFRTPDVTRYLDRLLSHDPLAQSDLYSISVSDIIDFLAELRSRLDLDTNQHWRQSFEVSCHASNLSRSVLEGVYRNCPSIFAPKYVQDFIDARIGAAYLEGWVPHVLHDGRVLNVRAMGARGVHIIAGNVPTVAVGTLLRCLVTRSDSIIKLPSNDLLTMVALARTMIDIDPNHPLTRHLSVAYWKGGDETVEREIYHPRNIEKIVAWGGFASIKHVTRYLQPGLDLITLDPKSSTTLIGREALADDDMMSEVARRAAADLGGWDQEACVNARVIFLESGTDPDGIAMANRFGQCLYEELQKLPRSISAGPVRFDPILKQEIAAIAPLREFYRVYYDPNDIEKSGAIIVSQTSDQVDFPGLLYGRVGNLVPVDRIESAIQNFSAMTQTVGIYPDSLRLRLRDCGALRGGQMFVPVGYAIEGSLCGPADGIEAERRMCRWIVDMHCDPAKVPGPWMHPDKPALIVEGGAKEKHSNNW